MIRHKLAVAMGSLLLAASTSSFAADDFRVAYAGSMGVVMDKFIGPAFADRQHVNYQGQGEGAYGLARLLASGKATADVFVSVTPGPIEILQKAGLVDDAVPVASTRMVIAYNPKSPFAAALAASNKDGAGTPWWQVLKQPGLKFGRTDARVDPQGQNIIFSLMLAEKYYRQPGLSQAVLGDTQNPQQVYGEGGLLSRLQAGQLDAASGYESATLSAKLPYVALPDEINLSNPAFAKSWYDTVSLDLTGSNGQPQHLTPQPLVFYAAVLKNAANGARGQAFVDFLRSSDGQALFSQNGYGQPKGETLHR
ncbi:extracellular solute-binding protein [Pseudomonas sp. NPDC090202]|uniref:extracellular solute-binding protein n=1 Tax=unclassified Pseudomonas TaxID=196821 RepID=UPI00381CF5B8